MEEGGTQAILPLNLNLRQMKKLYSHQIKPSITHTHFTDPASVNTVLNTEQVFISINEHKHAEKTTGPTKMYRTKVNNTAQ
jgi:hypothetical protein